METAQFPISVLGDATAASSVAAEDNGDFVVVWRGDGQDGSGQGVYGRRFRRPADFPRRLRKRQYRRLEPDRALAGLGELE